MSDHMNMENTLVKNKRRGLIELLNADPELRIQRVWGVNTEEASMVQYVDRSSIVQVIIKRNRKGKDIVGVVRFGNRKLHKDRYDRLLKLVTDYAKGNPT